jgi:CRP/FNR family transcriptional regulator
MTGFIKQNGAVIRQQTLAHFQQIRNLSDNSRQALAGISIPKNLKKKQKLFYEGEKGQCFYMLGAGSIKLFKTTSDGKESIVRVIRPGELFGEEILFEGDRFQTHSTAMQPSVVYLLPKHQFTCLLENKEIRNEFINLLVKTLHNLSDHIHYLSSMDVEDRFFQFLGQQYGRSERIVPFISKQNIASAIGAAPETFSRLIRRLEEEGKIQWKGKEIYIPEKTWLAKAS